MKGRVLAIIDRLVSRKLWVTIAGAVIVAVVPNISPELRAELLAGVGVVYVIVQGILDALQGQLPSTVDEFE